MARAAKELRDHDVLHTTLDDEDQDPVQGLGGHHSKLWEENYSLEEMATAILPKNWEQAMQMDAKGWTAALEKESAKFAEFEVFTIRLRGRTYGHHRSLSTVYTVSINSAAEIHVAAAIDGRRNGKAQ